MIEYRFPRREIDPVRLRAEIEAATGASAEVQVTRDLVVRLPSLPDADEDRHEARRRLVAGAIGRHDTARMTSRTYKVANANPGQLHAELIALDGVPHDLTFEHMAGSVTVTMPASVDPSVIEAAIIAHDPKPIVRKPSPDERRATTVREARKEVEAAIADASGAQGWKTLLASHLRVMDATLRLFDEA